MKINSNEKITAKIKKERNVNSQRLITKFLHFIMSCSSKQDLLRQSEVTPFDHNLMYKRINTCFLLFTVEDNNAVLIDYVSRF